MKKILALIAVAIFGFSGLSAFGQQVVQPVQPIPTAQASGKGKFENLTLTLTPLKSDVLPLEPIGFKIAVVNNSDTPIEVDGGLSFSASSVGLEIKKPDGKTVIPTQLSHVRGRILFFPKDLKTGEYMESTEVFDFKTQSYFGKPGAYQVRAFYRNSEKQQVYSDWVDLTLTDPIGTEKAAYEFLVRKMQKTYSPFTSWNTEELEEFLLNFAGTGYANHAHFRLGERYFEREKEKSEEQFRSITDGTFVYADQVAEKLKKLESKKNN